MAKKNEQVVAPDKSIEQSPTTTQTRLNEIAQSLAVELSGDPLTDIDIIVQKFEEIDQKLQPLAQQIENDSRVGQLIGLLSQGVALEDAVAEVSSLACDEQNPNYVKSLSEAEAFCDFHKMEHPQIECFTQFINDLFAGISGGKISKELLEVLWKSFVYDQEVEAAFNNGVIKGRNMQIEEVRSEHEQGDGLGAVPLGGNIEDKPVRLGYIEQIIRNRR